LFITVVILAACGSPKPAEHLKVIQQAGVIKVGTSADYPPFESIDRNGKKVGFDIALMEEIARRLQVKLEWVDMPFESLIAAVQEGKIDLAISAFNYDAERLKEIDFSEAYYVSEDALVVADSFAGQINSPEEVASYKVGVQSGTTQEYWLMEKLVTTGKLSETNLSRYERADQAAENLKNGRIEVWMADLLPAQTLADKLGGLRIAHKGSFSNGPMNIVMQKDDRSLETEINRIIRELDREGLIKQLAMQYLGGIE
jgi:polar amino acid transport system substrate-binding protein